jgi:lipoprotein-anchoring transpeptidase ErfK/SrfK
MKRASIAGLSVAAVAWLTPTAAVATSAEPSLFPIRIAPPPAAATPPADKPRPHRPIERNPDKVARVEGKITPPQGQLLITVSIDKQRVTLFADGKMVTSSPVSTGTPGHPTPMGVFSIIQKRRHHFSNLYGSSMPYMQRLTWSGVAMHQGPLPGRPASHGCVRLTNEFADFLWRTTRIGARVIITRDEVAPVEIAMPGVFARRQKTAEFPVPLQTLVKVADATGAVPIVLAQASTARTAEQPTKIMGEPTARTPETRTEPKAVAAEAAPVVTIDVGKTVESAATAVGAVANSVVLGLSRPLTAQPAANAAAPEQSTKLMGEPQPVTASRAAPAVPAPVVTAAPAPAQAAAPVVAAAAPVPAASAPVTAPVTASVPLPVRPPQPKVERVAEPAVPTIEPAPLNLEFAKPVERPAAAPVQQAHPQPSKAPSVVEIPALAAPAPIMREINPPASPRQASEPVRQATETTPAIPATEPVPSVREVKKSNEPVSIFVSRRDGKMYVRQRMAPLFDMPIAIKNPDQPIGTHVYTAMSVGADDTIRWTVVSLPSSAKGVPETVGKKPDSSRKVATAGSKPVVLARAEAPADPRAAIARLDIPAEAAERIAEYLMPGSSLIISDNKVSGETGEYTDFIILTP